MPSLPQPEEFFLDIPLYQSFKTTKACAEGLGKVVFFNGKVDAYCIHCKKDSVFSSNTQNPVDAKLRNAKASTTYYDGDALAYNEILAKTRYFLVTLECARNSNHTIVFIFSLVNDMFTKIGQAPSSADLTHAEIVKYIHVLGQEKYAEFNRAIGLSAHGVGIGSFVYLRRILEGLIEDAHFKAKTAAGWDDEAYQKGRIVEKILQLQNFLPQFLIEKRMIYSILSKGIHELSEEECLSMFPLLKAGIEFILDEKLQDVERQKKMQEVTKSLSKLVQQIK